MGKRELLLAAAFIVAGVAVYQFTAPPDDPNRPRRSLSSFFTHVRREIAGQRASAEATNTITIPVPATVQEIRIVAQSGAVTVTGEDRQDVEAVLHVQSRGYDDNEASRTAKATRIKVDEAGALLILGIEFPREGRQTASLALKVPSRLGIRMDGKNGEFKATRVAALALGMARGDTTISDVEGAVSIVQRGSQLTITNVGSLRLQSAAGAEVKVSNVQGDANLNIRSGDVRGDRFAGAFEVESQSADLQFEAMEKLRGPVRLNVTEGELTMLGVQTDTRIDGRSVEIRVTQSTAAPLAIYNEGSDPIELTTAPRGGFKLDALAVDGRVTVDEALQKAGLTTTAPEPEGAQPSGARREMRVTGTARGGGPTITLRSTRGDIVLRTK